MLKLLVTRLNDEEYIEWDTEYKRWYTWSYQDNPIEEEDSDSLSVCKSKEEINKVILLLSLGLNRNEIETILGTDDESNIPS